VFGGLLGVGLYYLITKTQQKSNSTSSTMSSASVTPTLTTTTPTTTTPTTPTTPTTTTPATTTPATTTPTNPATATSTITTPATPTNLLTTTGSIPHTISGTYAEEQLTSSESESESENHYVVIPSEQELPSGHANVSASSTITSQPAPVIPTIIPSSLPTSENWQCGPSVGTRCPPNNYCSTQGWCGTSSLYQNGFTAYNGIINTPSTTPLPAAALTPSSPLLVGASRCGVPVGETFIPTSEQPFPISCSQQCGSAGSPPGSMCPKGSYCSSMNWCGQGPIYEYDITVSNGLLVPKNPLVPSTNSQYSNP